MQPAQAQADQSPHEFQEDLLWAPAEQLQGEEPDQLDRQEEQLDDVQEASRPRPWLGRARNHEAARLRGDGG